MTKVHSCIYCGKPVYGEGPPVCEDCYPRRFEYETQQGFVGIKSELRARKYAEVLTPSFAVAHMLNMLEDENPDAFALDKTFLEPACGDGQFLKETLRRKLKNARTPQDGLQALSSIYGIDIQRDNVEASREALYARYEAMFGPSTTAWEIVQANIVWGNMLTGLYEGTGEKIWFFVNDCAGLWEYIEQREKKRGKKK